MSEPSRTNQSSPAPGPMPSGGPSSSNAERRRRRREAVLVIAAGLAVLVFALWEIRRPGASDGAVGNVFSFLLVNLNIILLLLMIFLVLRNLAKLYLEWRTRVPGSQLRTRMVLAFVTIATFPALVMLLISLEFSTNAIDGWFNSQVEESLRGAYRLAQTYYRDSADDALAHARAIGTSVAEEGLPDRGESTESLAEHVRRYQLAYGLGTIQVVAADGRQVVALFNEEAPTGVPMVTDTELLAETGAGKEATRIESLGSSDVVRGAAPIGEPGAVVGMVVVDFLIDESPRLWSQEILESFQEYRLLKLNKRPFKNLYVLTMALASLVVIFSATWLGLYLARGITDPLSKVVAATRRISDGDWDVELEATGGDEIGTLVDAFNAMTSELRSSHASLDERRRYIENVVNHIDAGVLSVDADGAITTVNPAAASLLGLDADRMTGARAEEALQECGYADIAGFLDELEDEAVVSGARLNVAREDEGRTLLVTATSLELSDGERSGYVLFIEDVAQVVRVQRMEAWREVARRIAHEIKNPLTPIQLSAQRMQRRLSDKLTGDDAALVNDCTSTIVSEVDGLKNLVNEFSQFARSSATEKVDLDLNAVVRETMPLFMQARPDLSFDTELGASLPAVSLDRDGVKRALVNLMNNAVAAVTTSDVARSAGDERADVTVRTRFDEEISRVVLEVADAGPGVPDEHRQRVFEPYFSTKDDGTGLGLAIVASIAADHEAFVRLHAESPHGSRFVMEFPVSASERPGTEGTQV